MVKMKAMANRKGITLAENVIAILLLGIIVAAAIFSLVSARMWVNAATHHYQAINIARDRLEDILAGGDATAGDYDVIIDPGPALAGILRISYPSTGTIQATVSWTEEMWTDKSSQETIVLILP